jgi:hypothetical protein
MPIHRQGLTLLVAAFTKKSIRGIFRQEYNITITKSRHDFGYKRGDISTQCHKEKTGLKKAEMEHSTSPNFISPKAVVASLLEPSTQHPSRNQSSITKLRQRTREQEL